LMMREKMSTGTGKTTEVFFSARFSQCLQIPELNTDWLFCQQAGLIANMKRYQPAASTCNI
jgi:hypothetical protein